MVVLGLAWFARFIVAVATPFGFAVGVLVGSVYLSVLAHLLSRSRPAGSLARPAGDRRRSSYLLSAPLDSVFLLLGASRGIADGPPPNGLVIVETTAAFNVTPDPVDLAVQVVVLACSAPADRGAGARRRAGAAQRRALGPGIWGGVVIVVTLMVQRTAFLLILPPTARVVFTWAAQTWCWCVWPLALLFGLFAQPAGPLGGRRA